MLVRWMFRRLFRDVPTWIKVAFVLAVLAYVGWYNFIRMPEGGSLRGYSYIERPIYSYWVNDNWGGNLAAFGGGTTCCWPLGGDSAKVVWIYGRTVEEFERGDEQERHSVTLPMPERTRGDRYLHVHFLPENRVELVWSPDFGSPLEEKLEQEYPRDD